MSSSAPEPHNPYPALEQKGGQADVFTALPGAEDVWAMAYDAKNKALYAATGPEGKLFRIDQQGKVVGYTWTGDLSGTPVDDKSK